MTHTTPPRTGGQILVDTLRLHGAERIFCVPGESYLAVLDALLDAPDIAVTVCRQESGAAMMADAYARCTGRPGVCFVTRGPGATNASAGLHIAQQDSTPVILFIGQIRRDTQEREAFQEIDYRRMLGPLTKWTAQIDDTARIPEMVSRAYHNATAGRPGPVALALPEDMLTETAEAPDAGPSRPVTTGVDPTALAELRERLAAAERPFVLAGGGGWDEGASAALHRFAESWDLPVGVSFRCQGYFDCLHPNYAGDVGLGANPELVRHIQASDLLIALGPKLGEATSQGYSLLDIPRPRQTFIHIHADAEELGRVYQSDLPINADMRAAPRALATLTPPDSVPWSAWTREVNASYHRWTDDPPANPGTLQMGEIITWLNEHLPEEAIIANGAGNYCIWSNRFYRYRRFRSMLAPTSGSMGYGAPAAIAAALACPNRPVVGFSGDGCFLMTGQELATAVQYRVPVVLLVVNNGSYGTIRMHQEREYPGRVSATDLHNPDFAALARSHGAHGERVEHTEEFPEAFRRAQGVGGPALIELMLDKATIAPGRSLGGG
ncbi:thiamine pyrophosphate-binding protein [Arhodomonas sp. SL1]|uniref:thiamine pyrophosphate-binding protein n=1 Tax=Arhodomonas sp. SL1 TaxID=3425691 RepID=UPI003F883196